MAMKQTRIRRFTLSGERGWPDRGSVKIVDRLVTRDAVFVRIPPQPRSPRLRLVSSPLTKVMHVTPFWDFEFLHRIATTTKTHKRGSHLRPSQRILAHDHNPDGWHHYQGHSNLHHLPMAF